MKTQLDIQCFALKEHLRMSSVHRLPSAFGELVEDGQFLKDLVEGHGRWIVA
jgi:hypothetical protein